MKDEAKPLYKDMPFTTIFLSLWRCKIENRPAHTFYSCEKREKMNEYTFILCLNQLSS